MKRRISSARIRSSLSHAMQNRTDTPAKALWSAAYNGDLPGTERLIAEGVDVNVWDQHGRSALTFASAGGHLHVVRRLVSAGAWVEPFQEDSVFMTPLMCAAEGGHIETAEFLLDHGADPTKHGGFSLCTAEYYARGRHGYLAAILRRAEDNWRSSKSR
jgi:ankyrin repeat protein